MRSKRVLQALGRGPLPAFLVLGLAAALAVSGCGGSSTASGAGSHNQKLVVAAFFPFTGTDASFGPEAVADCQAAIGQINSAGGVVGHKLTCSPFDSTSDPADALPVANRMVASTGNLAVVMGPAAGTAAAVEPLLDSSKVVQSVVDADPAFDHQKSPYYFRLPPSDSQGGVALALYAFTSGYKRTAVVFTEDQSAQSESGPFHSTYRKLGGHFSIDLTMADNQTSYRTEVARVLAAKPQALITEMPPQTAATFFSEMLQLNGGKLPPIITTSRATQPDWIGAVRKVLGVKTFEDDVTAVSSSVPANGAGYEAFKSGILALPLKKTDAAGFVADVYGQWQYDGVVLAALAMEEAKSTNSAKWAPYVPKVADGVTGALVVHTFAQGKQAIASGKPVRYQGASGILFLNKWNNNSVPFAGFRYNGNGTGSNSLSATGHTVTPAQLAQVENR